MKAFLKTHTLLAVVILTGILFWILNVFTIFVTDDIRYTFMIGQNKPLPGWDFEVSDKISSMSDIFTSLHNLYNVWGGRLVAQFLNHFFILIGKDTFNVLNTIVYCIFIFVTCFHITGSWKRITALLFVVVNILLWFLVPAWGENFLWLSGSCNYLWMITIALLFLIPFRTKMSNPEYKPSWGLSCLYLILGFLSGLSIENLSAAVGVFLGVYFVVKMIKKERFTPFEVLGCLGFMAGFCVLISAPGNYVRMAFSSMLTLFDRVWKLNTGFFSFSNALLTVLVIFIAFDLIFHQKKKLNGYIWAYFIAGCASIFSMIFAPYANERTYVFAIVFISIMLLNLLIYTPLPAIIKRNFFIILIIYAVSFAVAGRSIVGTYFKWEKRTQYILSQKEKGIKDIEIKTAIEAFNSHNAYSNFGDILDIGDQWNQITAKYYGVNSIKRVENDEVW